MSIDFIFFTKTPWLEPPRLRHQLAMLLANNGHSVYFFEKPTSFPHLSVQEHDSNIEGITLIRTSELINHKLRLFTWIRSFNAWYETAEINRLFLSLDLKPHNFVIVNFNYDYFFLRQLFPSQKIITIINDDFCCSALLGYQRPLRRALAATCQMSDSVLTVSVPLAEQLSHFCSPKLFFPWADSSYRRPCFSTKRNILVFWGYINNRLDFEYLLQFSIYMQETGAPYEILLVGPVQKGISPCYLRLLSMPNVSRLHSMDLHQLPLDFVLAAIIPYVSGNAADDVTTIPNKALPLLSIGLPLLVSGMPHLMEAPFVFRLSLDTLSDLSLIYSIDKRFKTLQCQISSFVARNGPSERYQEFMGLIDLA